MSQLSMSDLDEFGESEGGGESAEALLGRLIGEHYRVERELGRGGMGVVFLAVDLRDQSRVAIKMLSTTAAQSDQMRNRFRREAETASRLRHPGICGVHDVGEVEGLPYIVMDYVEGNSLATMLSRSRSSVDIGMPTIAEVDLQEETKAEPHEAVTEEVPRPQASATSVDEMVRLVERTARALHAAHEEGLIHRDVKPGNIMVTPEGMPVLLDFGLARDVEAVGQTLTQSGQIIGTPAYLAPEQIVGQRAQVDRRTDVYALGVTLYECLTLQRPFQGDTWDQLFHEILNGDWVSPRRLNPAIPPDLATVVEKAMDRDQHRRYATAEALAEDLKRVRNFRPIEARAPGPLLRARRWARRRPGKAAALATVVILVLAGAGFLVQQGISRALARREQFATAEASLAAGDFDAALEAVARARELDAAPERIAEIKARIERDRERAERQARRRADLAAARAAREEFRSKQTDYATRIEEIRDGREELRRKRSEAFDTYAPDALRGAVAREEERMADREIEAERLRQEARDALDRAARLESRWGGLSRETEADYAAMYMAWWREAIAAGDRAKAVSFREAVEKHDKEEQFRAELLGRGTMSLTVEPPDAELHLFRYEDYASVRPGDPIPRLVPVPTAGLGRIAEAPWSDRFHPGDCSLRITAVQADSPAAGAGLEAGDLVIALNGQPCHTNLFVRSHGAGPDGPGIPLLSRIVTIDGRAIETWSDWQHGISEGGPGRVRLAGPDGEMEVEAARVSPAPGWYLVMNEAVAPMRLDCLRDGRPVSLELAAGQRAGLRCRVTAYPLLHAGENRIRPRSRLDVDPGSYLVVARHPDREDLRFPVLVRRGEDVAAALELLPSETTPPGFVWIPPGPFVAGGDPEAALCGPREEQRLPGFWIALFEITNREWFAFVNDPETLKLVEESDRRRFLPRDPTRLIAVPGPEGKGWKHGSGGPQTPVLGISWNDAVAYVAWRNAKAEAAGEPWIYALPSAAQWEKAARGADGRAFPWGNRFDYALTVGANSRSWYLLSEPIGFEPRDVSPYGVMDLGGSREEWTQDAAVTTEGAPPAYVIKGGAWSASNPDAFRAAARGYRDADYAGGSTGLRLVVRRRP